VFAPVVNAVDAPGNIRIEDSLLKWDSVPQANSYNIYYIDGPVVDVTVSPRYITTVSGSNAFRPSTRGYYTVVSVVFSGGDQFSDVAEGEVVFFAGNEQDPNLISRSEFFELRTLRCSNQVAGSSCAIQCANNVRRIPTGGACRADAGVVLHQRARQNGYECLVQQDSSFVEVDVYCLNSQDFFR